MNALIGLKTDITRLAQVQFERGRLAAWLLVACEIKKGKPFDQARVDRYRKQDAELQKEFLALCESIGIHIGDIRSIR